ncbi:uncharacterized protein LOC141840331 isoform X2 [Curcuma longa]
MLDHGSISFGRFPIETLSWERRSVFTHNRCQEELEKFNGLVAKKKAYFEERYRRIRAMKAEQNQQTELTLDYSGDCSISSQSGEEDAAAIQHENIRDGNSVHSSTEEAKPGTSHEQEISHSEPLQERCLCPDSTLPNHTLRIEVLDSPKQTKNSDDMLLVQPSENPSPLPHTDDLEEKSHFRSDLDHKEVMQKPQDKVLDLKPRRVRQGTTLDTSKSNSHQSQAIGKSLDYKSIFYVKDLASGRNIRGEPRMNMVRSSKGVRTTSKMASQTPIRAPTCTVKSSTRPLLAASSGPPIETHTILTTPGLFTLVMERRASKRGSTEKLTSGGSNMHASKPSHPKDSSSAQVTMNKNVTTNGLTKRRPEVKRDIKEVRSIPLAVDSRSNSLKQTQALVAPPKSRTQLATCVRVETQIQTTKGAKQKEGNAKDRQFQQVDAKIAPMVSRNLTATKKPLITPQTHSSQGRKQSKVVDNLSVDGRKTRRSETPKWR